MKPNTRGFVVIVIVAAVAVFIAISALYYYQLSKVIEKQEAAEAPVQKDTPASFSIATTSEAAMLLKNGMTLQIVALDPEIIELDERFAPSNFIIDQDVNFDGRADLAVLTGVGYGGVNYFYDYYLFDPVSEKLIKSETLTGVSNPTVDAQNRRVISSYRSGPQWYTQSFDYNGAAYASSTPQPVFSDEGAQ